MHVRRSGTIAFVVVVSMFVAAPFAHAHDNHATAPAPVAGADANAGLPPVVAGGGGGGAAPVAPANANAPAHGAQPAAPGGVGVPEVDEQAANPDDVAADAEGVDPDAAVEEVEVGAGDVVDPVEVDVRPDPVVAPAPAHEHTVDGGGTDGSSTPAEADDAGAPPAAGGGDLPFTGLAENLLIISLAGMFVPIGVLLYCGARRGEQRWLRRHLSGPRFQWADERHGLR